MTGLMQRTASAKLGTLLVMALLGCLTPTQPRPTSSSKAYGSWELGFPALERLRVPKVALMFLTRGPMPHEKSWAAWLGAAKWLVPGQHANATTCSRGYRVPKNAHIRHSARKSGSQHYAEQALFTLYVHSPPDHEGYAEDTVFRDRELDMRVKVQWGDHAMVVAMRLLLRAALEEVLNQRFVYLCEQTLPLYPPTLVWQQLMTESKSRVNACPHPRDERKAPKYSLKRWSPLMLPYITQEMWIKSSQWAGLTRELAEVVDRDTLILNIFGKFCRAPSCVGDEHYLSVVLAYHHLANQTNCAGNAVSCTWDLTDVHHPLTFPKVAIVPDLFVALRHNYNAWKDGSLCDDRAALRRAPTTFIQAGPQWEFGCPETKHLMAYDPAFLVNGSCMLFARKFDAAASPEVLELITGCDSRLWIAPKHTCKAEEKQRKARMVALLKRDLNAKSAAKVAQAQQSALERVFAGQHGAKTA